MSKADSSSVKLFVSDLHLHESRPEVTRGFYRFLQEQAAQADELYILGDFFDVWIGDDDDQPLVGEAAEELHKVSSQGVSVYIMHGNRDFLMGENFAASSGARLVQDPHLIALGGRSALLMHGDSLCTDDKSYMDFRAMVRSEKWQSEFLAQPLAVRRKIAQDLRERSTSMNSSKAEDIMDVAPKEVEHAMESAGVDLLIHGHTHRPDRHSLSINAKPAERIVLGDWHDEGWCLRAEGSELLLESWGL